jgi:hypothetical protein
VSFAPHRRHQAGHGRCRSLLVDVLHVSVWPYSTTWPIRRRSRRQRPLVCHRRGSRGRSSHIALLPLLRQLLLQLRQLPWMWLVAASNLSQGREERKDKHIPTPPPGRCGGARGGGDLLCAIAEEVEGGAHTLLCCHC